MGRRISESIRRFSTLWLTLSALAVFLLFSALVLPGQAATADTYAEEAGSPNTRGFYSAEDLVPYHSFSAPQNTWLPHLSKPV